MRRVLLAVVLLLGVSSIDAFFVSGNDLLSHMKNCDKYDAGQESYDNYYGCAFGTAYVDGVFDSHHTLQGWKGFENHTCFPDGVTDGQLRAVVRKYLDNHPEGLHKTASGLALNAFYDAFSDGFPCE